MLEFSREKLSECVDEIKPILRYEHWEEVGHYKDIPIDMEWDKYEEIERLGKLRCYTVRSLINEEFRDTVLCGYAFFIVDKHLHYRHTTVAQQDILFIRKAYRGTGRSFLSWCDNELMREGVTSVTHHAKPWFNYGSLFEKLGYEKAETIWARRLD